MRPLARILHDVPDFLIGCTVLLALLLWSLFRSLTHREDS